jgi:hypothetical protein
MNAARRKELDRAAELVDEAKQIIEAVKDQEQEAFDNTAESLQGGERGQKMEEAIEALDDAGNSCEEIVVFIATAKGK